jgi:drug/metabolite transporter (DMT)-like permease
MPLPSAPRSNAQKLATANRRGITALSLAMASFIANDTLVKYVSQTLGGGQLIFIRGAFATVLLLGVAHAMGATAQMRSMLTGPLALRALLDALATMTYLTALFHLPIGNATAINMATPLFITVFAVVFLKERVHGLRWLAIAAGFGGVILVVQPRSEGFTAWSLLCLLGTLFHASRDLLTRAIPLSVPSVLITLSTAVSVSLLAGPVSLVQGWRPVTLPALGLLAAAAVFLAGGYYLIINSLREGEMSVIAPFRYTGLLFALVLGWLVWGEVPNALAWAGIALLVGAGLYMLHSERNRGRAELDPASD